MLSCKPFECGDFPGSASLLFQGCLCWPHLPKWSGPSEGPGPRRTANGDGPGVADPNGATHEQNNINGEILRKYAMPTRQKLGFDDDPKLRKHAKPYAPSFIRVVRTGQTVSCASNMVSARTNQGVPFDPECRSSEAFH